MTSQSSKSESVPASPGGTRIRLNARGWLDTLDTLLFLAPLALIFDLAGYAPSYLARLIIYLFWGVGICLHPCRKAMRSAGILVVVLVVNGFLPLPSAAEICLLMGGHLLVWRQFIQMPSRLEAGLCAYTFLHLLLFLSPSGVYLLHPLAAAANRIAGFLTGSAYHLGWSYPNLGALLLYGCLSLFAWDATRISRMRTLAFLVVALLLHALMAAVMIRFLAFDADLIWELKYRDIFGWAELFEKVQTLAVLVAPLLPFAVYTVAYLALHHDARSRDAATSSPTPRHQRSVLVVSGAVAALAVITSLPPTLSPLPTSRRLLLVERGVVSYSRPDYTRFGRAAGGMYGMLPDYARLFGCVAEIVPDIPEHLDPKDILVLTNLDEALAGPVQQRLWDFVDAGGGLWVLGDHTFIKNGRNHINDLLAPARITLRHDSAQFFPQGWFHSYRFRQGTPFAGLTDAAENRPSILVGASLELRPPAQAFILGRFGYSDWGTDDPEDKRGYIGDFEYQAGEQLGDLVLVAGQRYGQGRVLVFGDTTSFFNNNLSRSFEVLRASLSWLGQPADPWPWGLHAVLMMLALGGVWLLLLNQRRPPLWMPMLGTAMVCSFLVHTPRTLLPWDTDYARQHLVLLDYAHQPNASKHSAMGSGLHGVSINLMRHGLLPVAMNHWDPAMLDHAALLVSNAPRSPYTARERRDLDRMMDHGGHLLLACGYLEYPASRSLLEAHQVQVRGLPLGRFFDSHAFGSPISFYSGWPLVLKHPRAEVLCQQGTHALIASMPSGAGRLVVIGDSEFLHNRNLEGSENHDPANVQFFRSLMDHLFGKDGS